jgi:hypothetical protein
MQPYYPNSQCVSFVQNFANFDFIKACTEEQTMFLRQKGHHKLDNSVDKLYLCHVTKFFPKTGVIKPRMILKKAKEPVASLLSVVRPTVHFTLNYLVQETEEFNLKDRKFAIIDRYESSQNQMVGGYLEDIFCIGPYKLSKDAAILVPNSLKEDVQLQEEIAKLNGRVKEIIFYDDGTEKALAVAMNAFLADKQAPVFQSVVDDDRKPNLLSKLDKGRFFSSQSFMVSQKKIFCTHDITPMAQLERFLVLNQDHLVDFAATSKSIKEYMDGVSEAFPFLQQQHKDFLLSYSKAVRLAMKVFIGTKGNPKKMEINFKKFEQEITQHDQPLIEQMLALDENKEDG